jgi:hypothetical protein
MRILTGFLIFIDGIRRSFHVEHYSNNGYFNAQILLEENNPLILSLNLVSGSEYFQYLLIFFYSISGIFFAYGYLSKLFCFTSLIILISFLNRNPFQIDGGYSILLWQLAWCLFIPLSKGKNENNKTYGIGSFSIIMQFFCIYFSSGIFKIKTQSWLDGSAALLSARFESLTWPTTNLFLTPLLENHFLSSFSTYLVIIIELFAPLILLLPLRNDLNRYICCFSLMCFHLGLIFVFGGLGMFPFFCIAFLSVLIPTNFWKNKKLPNTFLKYINFHSYLESKKQINIQLVVIVCSILFSFMILSNLRSHGLIQNTELVALENFFSAKQQWAMFTRDNLEKDFWCIITDTNLTDLTSRKRYQSVKDLTKSQVCYSCIDQLDGAFIKNLCSTNEKIQSDFLKYKCKKNPSLNSIKLFYVAKNTKNNSYNIKEITNYFCKSKLR